MWDTTNVYTCPAHISVPESLYGCARKHNCQEDSQVGRNNVSYEHIAQHSEGLEREDLKIKHDEGHFDHAEDDDIGDVCDEEQT